MATVRVPRKLVNLRISTLLSWPASHGLCVVVALRLISFAISLNTQANSHTQAVGPQSLRGLPNGFPGPQQVPQNRSVSNRLPPSGKMGTGAL
jgi:hypothetical protein